MTYSSWGPEGPGPLLPWAEKGGKDDSNVVPFRTTRLTACTCIIIALAAIMFMQQC